MANYKQCPQGHYYDPTIYSECPYCSDVSRGVASTPGLGSSTIPVNFQSNTAPVNYTPAAGQPIPTAKVMETGPSTPLQIPTQTKSIGGKTEPAPINKKDVEDPTTDEDDTKFVVGWLVAVEGPYRGKSFELHNGYCFIGREKGDIVLNEDNQVTSEKNLSTVYDSDNNCFYVVGGESRNVAQFNGKALLSGMSKDMNAYDTLKVGTTKFIFVPFCCEKFSWNKAE